MAESWVAVDVEMEASETGFGKSIVYRRRWDLGSELLLRRFSEGSMDDKR